MYAHTRCLCSVCCSVTCTVAIQLALNETEIMEILSQSIGFVFFLEVDECIYEAFKKSTKSLDEGLFEYELTAKQCKDTIYEKHDPLAVKTAILILI